MNIEIFLLIFKIFVIAVFLMLILWLWFNRENIDSFFHPENYAIIDMMESDNNSRVWLQRKNKDLRFLFNDGWYNMYELELPGNKEQEKKEEDVTNNE